MYISIRDNFSPLKLCCGYCSPSLYDRVWRVSEQKVFRLFLSAVLLRSGDSFRFPSIVRTELVLDGAAVPTKEPIAGNEEDRCIPASGLAVVVTVGVIGVTIVAVVVIVCAADIFEVVFDVTIGGELFGIDVKLGAELELVFRPCVPSLLNFLTRFPSASSISSQPPSRSCMGDVFVEPLL